MLTRSTYPGYRVLVCGTLATYIEPLVLCLLITSGVSKGLGRHVRTVTDFNSIRHKVYIFNLISPKFLSGKEDAKKRAVFAMHGSRSNIDDGFTLYGRKEQCLPRRNLLVPVGPNHIRKRKRVGNL